MRSSWIERGFTLPELLVIVGILAVLAEMVLPALSKAKAKSQRIACVGGLKQIGLGFRVSAADHNGRYPMDGWTNAPGPSAALTRPERLFGLMSNELSVPYILACPADNRKAATSWTSLRGSNISYFVGLEASESLPETLLAGDRNLATNGVPLGPGLVGVASNAAGLGWTAAMHRNAGNVVLGDGSVQQMTTARLAAQFRSSGVATNWLVVP